MKITQKEGEPEVPAAVLAQSIKDISDCIAAWERGGMNQRALLVLLSDNTRLSKSEIRRVLDGIKELKRDYCK